MHELTLHTDVCSSTDCKDFVSLSTPRTRSVGISCCGKVLVSWLSKHTTAESKACDDISTFICNIVLLLTFSFGALRRLGISSNKLVSESSWRQLSVAILSATKVVSILLVSWMRGYRDGILFSADFSLKHGILHVALLGSTLSDWSLVESLGIACSLLAANIVSRRICFPRCLLPSLSATLQFITTII